MNSKRIDKAAIKVGNAKATLSWVEIDGDWGRGYHEIAWWTKGSKSKVNVLDTQLSEDEARTLFYLLLQGKVLINPASVEV